MNEGYAIIDVMDLAIVAGLLAFSSAIALAARIGVTRSIAWAAIRMVVQLSAIGFVLRWLFNNDQPIAVAAALFIMIAAAAITAVRRPTRTFPRAGILSFAVLAVCGLGMTLGAVVAVLDPAPWYSPVVLIPILGMVLGNGLTGISLCIGDLLDNLAENRGRIEMDLAHGATRWEAARDPIAQSVRRGMVPITNAMSVVGIVSLPGMMTGQILAGAPALEAAKYQMMILLLIAAVTLIVCIGVTILACWSVFNAKHQLCTERIIKRE